MARCEPTRPLLTLEGTVQTIIMSERIEVKKSELPDDAFKKVSFSEGGMGPLIKEADMTHIMGMHIPKLCYVEVTYSDNFTEKYRWYAQHDAWGLWNGHHLLKGKRVVSISVHDGEHDLHHVPGHRRSVGHPIIALWIVPSVWGPSILMPLQSVPGIMPSPDFGAGPASVPG